MEEPRLASVIATEPTECFSLSRESFLRLIESAPQISFPSSLRGALIVLVDDAVAELLDRPSDDLVGQLWPVAQGGPTRCEVDVGVGDPVQLGESRLDAGGAGGTGHALDCQV